MTASELTTDRLNILRGWWPKTWFERLNGQQKYEISRKGAKAQRRKVFIIKSSRLAA
jgi:hypothetical protein